uniref:Uncharacterized protein n=1 Tax=Skeletonema marinoi TaxID=267567 RepID=A0A6U3SH26_9STRA|mmetsp:Transcript_11008/g.18764  ORF Transcript_11008/g.18764 Transcript_11008/m.18764 type:complete len:315 (+) Transcript_11008:74-1018(+)
MKFIPTILTLLLVAPSTADLRPVSDIRIRRSQVDVADSQKDNMIGSGRCAEKYPVVAIEQFLNALVLSSLLPILVYGPDPQWPLHFGVTSSVGALLGDGDHIFHTPLELFQTINSIYAEFSCEEYQKEGQSSLLMKSVGRLFDSFDILPLMTGRVSPSSMAFTPETEDLRKNKKYGSDSCAGTYAAVAIEQVGVAVGLSYFLSDLLLVTPIELVPSMVALLGDDDETFDNEGYVAEGINSIYAEMSCGEYEREGQYSLLIATGKLDELLFGILDTFLPFETGMDGLGFFNSASAFTPGESSNSTPTPETEDSSP